MSNNTTGKIDLQLFAEDKDPAITPPSEGNQNPVTPADNKPAETQPYKSFSSQQEFDNHIYS